MLKQLEYIEGHDPFDCPDCGGPVEAGHFTTETFASRDQVAVVYAVPVSECRQCGQTYTDGRVTEHLEKMVRPHLDVGGSRLWAARYDGPVWTWEQQMRVSGKEKRG